jgi:hypothetical protein
MEKYEGPRAFRSCICGRSWGCIGFTIARFGMSTAVCSLQVRRALVAD